MAELNYAFIKNNLVINIGIFDNPSSELINTFKIEHNVDIIILANEKTVIGGTYDGSKFWLPQPYPSWIKNEELNEWEPPVPYPQDGEYYIWDENTTSWLLLPPSN